MQSVLEKNIVIRNLLPNTGLQSVKNEIIEGLNSEKKYISSKFFYDETGSKLFDKITRLKEYYPARTEKSIIAYYGNQFLNLNGNLNIIEIGSGNSSKISILINKIPENLHHSVDYIPVDISSSSIKESVEVLLHEFPGITINGIVADFMSEFNIFPNVKNRLFCFFGSTIGNLSRNYSLLFIKNLSNIMNKGDQLLLGLDMVKNKEILENAYNDKQQITAEFNKNILSVMNKLIGTNFIANNFDHYAFYNEEKSRIEMHLKAIKSMYIKYPGNANGIKIIKGETIHTENSYKYTPYHISEFAASGRFIKVRTYSDKNKWFSIVKFTK